MVKGGSIHAIGRRKTSIARVFLKTDGSEFTVNDKPVDEYFEREVLRAIVWRPLEVVEKKGKISLSVNVVGGGKAGQAGAVLHGVSRALVKLDETLRGALKSEGFLTRDDREVERKKYGRHKARKRPQYSKR